MRPPGSFPAGPGDPGGSARGTGPRARPGWGDRRPPPPPRARRPRSPRALPRASAARLCSRPRGAGRCGPAAPAARVARPPRWHRESPRGRPSARAHTARRRRRLLPAQRGGRGSATPPRRRRPSAAGARAWRDAPQRHPPLGDPRGSPAAGGGLGGAAARRRLGAPRLHPGDPRPERVELPREEGGGGGAGGPGRGWGKGALPASGSACPVPGDRLLPTVRAGEGVALAGIGRALLGMHTPRVDAETEREKSGTP